MQTFSVLSIGSLFNPALPTDYSKAQLNQIQSPRSWLQKNLAIPFDIQLGVILFNSQSVTLKVLKETHFSDVNLNIIARVLTNNFESMCSSWGATFVHISIHYHFFTVNLVKNHVLSENHM